MYKNKCVFMYVCKNVFLMTKKNYKKQLEN